MTSHELDPERPVAVVGIGLRAASCAGPDALWRGLCARDVFLRDLAEDHYLAQSAARSARGDAILRGWLDAPASTAPTLLGVKRSDVGLVCAQHALAMECVWRALEDAALVPGQDHRYSIYLAANGRTMDARNAKPASGFARRVNSEPEFLSTRLAYLLDLRGEAMLIQSACSSALTAVHLAVASLQRGDCDVAIAGGVSIDLQPRPADRHPTNMVSATGCRPFNHDADGMVECDGAAVVVLRRLADVLRDGDHAYAAILGSAASNDGHAKTDYYAPGVDGQVDAIRTAINNARIDPRRIRAIETHGTGTLLGDSIEVRAIVRAFDELGRDKRACALGSVKANFGHCIHAAGALGLIKASLSAYHRSFAPQAQFDRPASGLSLERAGLSVSAEAVALDEGDVVGVSSFGIGGTNVHLLVTPLSAGPTMARAQASGPRVAVLSAESPAALSEMRRTLHAHLCAARDALHPDDITKTLAFGRARLPHRWVARFKTTVDLIDRLVDDDDSSFEAQDELLEHWLQSDVPSNRIVGRRIPLPGHPIAPAPAPLADFVTVAASGDFGKQTQAHSTWTSFMLPYRTGLQARASRQGDASPTAEEILVLLRHLVAHFTGMSSVDDDAELRGLGIGSLDSLELLDKVEAALGRRMRLILEPDLPLRRLAIRIAHECAEIDGDGQFMWQYDLPVGDEIAQVQLNRSQWVESVVPEGARNIVRLHV
jgi:acyl transferase domain-containing protein